MPLESLPKNSSITFVERLGSKMKTAAELDLKTHRNQRLFAFLADQLLRVGSSVTLNIAEGAGEFSKSEKIRFYRMAKRSATECAGILDVCQRLELLEESNLY